MHALVNNYRINDIGVLAILISGPRSEKRVYTCIYICWLPCQYPQREYFLLKLSYDGDPMLSGPRIKYLLHASCIRAWPHLILRHANFITNKTGGKNSVCIHIDDYIGIKLVPVCIFSFPILFSFPFFLKRSQWGYEARNVLGICLKTNPPKNVVAILVCENRKSL